MKVQTIGVLLLALIFSQCQIKKKIIGNYLDESELGTRTLEIKPNSTFLYKFNSKLMKDSLQGIYELKYRQIIFKYDVEKIDTTKNYIFSVIDTTGFDKKLKENMPKFIGDPAHIIRPKRYLFKENKLYEYDIKGKRISESVYNKITK